ncbi:MAG: arginine--tRNA ligase [Candidatus Micrarchaeota archaeon]|nr:arginine--tRNA ligase [Candidatus Micrarchaeota archaeon]
MGYALSEAEEAVREAVAPALKSLRIRVDSVPVREAAPGFGDLSCPVAFAAAKQLKELGKKPDEIASEISVRVNTGELSPWFEKVDSAGGFVNFWLSRRFFEKAAGEAARLGKDFGKGGEFKGKTAVIDYSAPNVGKPLHVGHARSTVYGDAVKRLLAAVGYKTVGFNYPGDAGKPVAELIVAMRRFKGLPPTKSEKELMAYYVKINKEIEKDPALAEEVRDVLEKIEAGDRGVLGEVLRIREMSMQAFDRTYALLGVSFDETVGESEFIAPAKKIAAEALEKGAAEKGKDGETVALLEKTGLPNTLLMRSNGTTLYFSRDLALADYKWKKHAFDLNFYATAAEQNLHFRQAFAFLKILGRPYAGRCAHVGFGLVSLPEGRISTRHGRVVLLEDMLAEATAEARKEVEARLAQIAERTGKKYSAKDVEGIAREVGVGASKFAMLRVSPEKEILFDFKKIVSFEGDTGAYLQYTFVRAANILRKAGMEKAGKTGAGGAGGKSAVSGGGSGAWEEEEKRVAKMVSFYPRVVSDAAKSYRPHIVCDYLLKLAADFSSFYEKCPVLKAEGGARARRLEIVEAVKTVLGNGLELLGIAAPEKM